MLLLPATSADAHVRVHADSTAAGSFSALTFRVPNESDTASTVKVAVQLPTDTPFLYVSTRPVPGWTAVATEATLPKPVDSNGTTLTKAVRTVTWTADKASAIAPGEYQEFSISAGPLPAAPGTVLLPADQTYSDGTVVKWKEPTPAGGAEPEHPAPELVVTAAEPESGSSAAPAGAAQTGPTDSTTAATTGAVTTESDPVARVLGGVGLVLGVIALAVAVLTRRRRASSAA